MPCTQARAYPDGPASPSAAPTLRPVLSPAVKPGYVPEIDGLRTVAVLAVLFYHAGFRTIGGGFVGVDVFFVISGYLITRLIRDEVEATGRFSFLDFYVRRVRRLFPALVATILGSALLAALLFSPQQLMRFAASAVAAVFSLSNVLFWLEADYFDAIASTKPLLHTWSLAVEEQFYFLWPVTLTVLLARWPRRGTPVALGLLCLASLVLAEIWIGIDRAGAFFLLPTRVVELGIGAALVWLAPVAPRGRLALEGLCLAGFVLIGCACLAFTEQTPFPGLAALVPCLGAALVILGAAAPVTALPLRLAPVVWTGRISYSLYLVHWPVVVFYEAFLFDDLGLADRWAVVGLSFALAALQHRFVEERFRHVRPEGLPGPVFLGRAALAASALAAAGGATLISGGWPGRIPADRLVMTNREQRLEVERRYCAASDPRFVELGDIFTCQVWRGEDRDIVLWGDSHAMHLVPGFARAFPDHNLLVAFQPACAPQRGFGEYRAERGREDCARRNHAVLEALDDLPPTDVVISGAKRGDPAVIAGATGEMVAALEAQGHRVVVLGDVIRPDRARDLADCANVPEWLVSDARRAARCVGDPETVGRELDYNAVMAEKAPRFVQINDLQCPEGACAFFADGRILFRDDHHLTIEGSERFVAAALPRIQAEWRRGPKLGPWSQR